MFMELMCVGQSLKNRLQTDTRPDMVGCLNVGYRGVSIISDHILCPMISNLRLKFEATWMW